MKHYPLAMMTMIVVMMIMMTLMMTPASGHDDNTASDCLRQHSIAWHIIALILFVPLRFWLKLHCYHNDCACVLSFKWPLAL